MTMPELLDVSSWQPTTPSLTGKAGLIARATYGTAGDSMFSTHTANARKLGLAAGSFHFGRAVHSFNADANGHPVPVTLPIASQVAAYLSRAHDADLFALDQEKDTFGTAMSQAEAAEFIYRVQATGRKMLEYHSESGFPKVGQDGNWVANWSQIPAIPFVLHQYRGSPLDLDHFNGTLAQLQAFVHKPKPATWTAHISGPDRAWFTVYHVSGDHVTGSRIGTTHGFTVDCKAPADYTFAGHATQRLVVLTSGSLYLKAKALGITVAVRAVYGRES